LDTVDWLLDSDPAIRRQAMRDLTDASSATVAAEKRRQADGRWLLDRAYDEALAIPVGEPVGGQSRWNTLRALRVLRWYRSKKWRSA
jgi:hypothetical protein